MSVTRIYESPRVTLPYTEEQWKKIESLGHAIDADLKKGDVRLTMGGEPTFVSIDDPDGPEWNFTAVSHKKRVLSGELIKRLRKKFAPGSLLHYGQGKWYPGEPLPRWALAAYWRKDGVPIWKDDSLIADESKDYGHGAKEAKELLVAHRPSHRRRPEISSAGLRGRVLLHVEGAPPAVQRHAGKIQSEGQAGARPHRAHFPERAWAKWSAMRCPSSAPRLATSLAGCPAPWFLRDDDTLWLIPGDSPMGLRLPLDSIPWVAEKDYPWIWQQDPSNPSCRNCRRNFRIGRASDSSAATGFAACLDCLPWYGRGSARATSCRKSPKGAISRRVRRQIRDAGPRMANRAPWIIRTALCVEPRDGRLHVFMPPVATTEDYLDLVAGIETAVTEMGTPVIIEGETPPRDPRLNKLAVTPDPGVIEVNLHPSKSWDELVERTTVLYEEARQTRLGTEKFMLDGRHTGTGGGNHIIIGGETPQDSPVLRRPDLLRSLLAYWQNHPSLSWLFSGLFIGPTSQAPRMDEARNDSLYELEVAFKELDRQLAATEEADGRRSSQSPP